MIFIIFIFRALFPEQPRSFEEWEVFFQDSAAVHFASSQTSDVAHVGKLDLEGVVTIAVSLFRVMT